MQVIRYRLEVPELARYSCAFFSIKYQLQAPRGAITHFSVVNHDVSDGRIWEVQPDDCSGCFSLSGVLNGPMSTLIVYVNVKGPGVVHFKPISLTLAGLVEGRTLKIAFVVDPWIERSDPRWKSDYIWWFGKIETALRSSGRSLESIYLISDAVADDWDGYKPTPESRCEILPVADLIRLFGSHRSGLKDQRRRLRPDDRTSPDTASSPERGGDVRLSSFRDILKKSLPWRPDVVIAMSDMQILKDAFPDSLILYRDALYCREPFPDELTSFDIQGLYRNSSCSSLLADRDAQSDLPEVFTKSLFPESTEVKAILESHGLAAKTFQLLPLQDSRHYNFYDESPYSDQVELAIAVASQFPNERILITQHPDNREISIDAIARLRRLYPNLIYVAELERFKNLSARLLPYASGVIGVSTGILVQALCLGLPVKLMGRHALEEILAGDTSETDRRKIAFTLLTRFYASYRYLYDRHWFLSRLCAFELLKRDALLPESMTVDLPHNVLHFIERDKRAYQVVGTWPFSVPANDGVRQSSDISSLPGSCASKMRMS